MNNDLAQEAVNCALNGKWKEAVLINKSILNDNPNDIDALNRLARAYTETGEVKKAKGISLKVIKIDPSNRIAIKSLARFKDSGTNLNLSNRISSPESFLEESGKTKITPLLYPGDPKIVSNLFCGDIVKLSAHAHRVSICTQDGRYIGRLSDDLSSRLRKLIEFGNEYMVLIKSIDMNNIKVLIRETKRAKQISDVSSFPPEKIEYVSFTPPELVHKRQKQAEVLEE